jgi:hypothetical protein
MKLWKLFFVSPLLFLGTYQLGKAATPEKCFQKNWKSGNPERFKVSMNSQLCLDTKFDTPTSDMGSEVKAQTHAAATIFNTDLSLLFAGAEALAPLYGTPSVSGDAYALGYKVWEEYVESPTIDIPFEMPVLTLQPKVERVFMFGVLPANVSVTVTSTIKLSGDAKLAIANAKLNFIPNVASVAEAEVKTGAILVEAGSLGEVLLLNENISLQGQVALGVNPEKEEGERFFYTASAKGFENRSFLDGKIHLFLQAKGRERKKYLLANLKGKEFSGELFNFYVEPTPIETNAFNVSSTL